MKHVEDVFNVHRILQARRNGISAEELCERTGCSASGLKRTLAFLRDTLHAPLIFDAARGGYRYDGDGLYELPGLWLSAEELAALLVIDEALQALPPGLLSDALAPLRRKLDHIASRAGLGDGHWHTRLRLRPMAARPVGNGFRTVAKALLDRRRLRLEYHARHDDRWAVRDVSPQRLVLYRDNWYLDGWCHLRRDLRRFALDRIIDAQLLDEPAQEVDPEQLEALNRSYGIFAGQPDSTAVLRFSARAARWVTAETWHPQQQDQRAEDGGLIRRIPYHRPEELLLDILRHGPEVEVLEPPALRAAIAERLRRALRAYEPPPEARPQPADALQESRLKGIVL